jgi:hypothetical protein
MIAPFLINSYALLREKTKENAAESKAISREQAE